jgi:GntR family transcriptional regulator, transcriptional repressor for pyruvate dehydrogenase complex
MPERSDILGIVEVPQRRTNLVSELAVKLKQEILEGRLQPGDRLPTELELSMSAKVSRTVVREAVASLRAEGLVETRQGAGAFVVNSAKKAFRPVDAELATAEDIIAVLELRLAIEFEAASLAANRRTEDDLAKLQMAMLQFSEARRQGLDTLESDLCFHRALAEATHNRRFVSSLSYLGEFAFPRRLVPEKSRLALPASHLELADHEHQAIYKAIAAKNAPNAASAMRTHLAGSLERYSATLSRIKTNHIPPLATG